MGQVASQTWSEQDQELWKKGQKTDLFTLVDTELQELLQIKPMISLNEIRQVGMTIQKQKSSKSSSSEGRGYYAHDADRPQTQLALRLNGMSKELLAKHRFQLVPSRLKEPIFWEATILLLQERLEQHNERCRLEQQQQEQGEGGGEQETETNNNNNNHTKQNTMGKAVSSSSSSFSIPDDQQRLDERVEKSLISRLALKEFEISTLKEQVQELQKQLQSNSMSTPRAFATTTTTTATNTTNASSLSSSSSSPTTTTSSNNHHHQHTGEWIMDRDSQEFLQYPEEIKTNMRKEKQRRLDQVQKEMKFILDSDNMEDTNGHWTCCGANSYRAESCQQQQQ